MRGLGPIRPCDVGIVKCAVHMRVLSLPCGDTGLSCYIFSSFPRVPPSQYVIWHGVRTPTGLHSYSDIGGPRSSSSLASDRNC